MRADRVVIRARRDQFDGIATEDNEVSNVRTVLANLKGALTGMPKNVKAYFDIADTFAPDVVISDFESWSYLFGMNRMIPVVSVDNIQMVTRCTHAPCCGATA